MNDASVIHNCEQSPLSGAVLNEVTAQQHLVLLVNRLAATTTACWWKLLGEEPNSVCKFLDTSWEDMRLILRTCGVLHGPTDSFKTKKFEDLMGRIGCDWVLYRPSRKIDQFLRLGEQRNNADAVQVPKDMYSHGGILDQWPVSGVHMPAMRTKGCKCLSANLTSLCSNSPGDAATETEWEEDSSRKSNKGTMTIYVNDLLDAMKKEIMEAAMKGEAHAFTHRTRRMLRKACARAIKGSIRSFVDTWVEHIGEMKEGAKCVTSDNTVLETPATTRSQHQHIEIGTSGSADEGNACANINITEGTKSLVTPPTDLTTEEDDDERDMDIVLSNLKEETILQNLLHKRLLSACTFELEFMLIEEGLDDGRRILALRSHASKCHVQPWME